MDVKILEKIRAQCKCGDDDQGDCWVARTKHPTIRVGKSVVMARRAAYEAEYGPIPPKRVITPKCEEECCVRPSHQAAKSFQQMIRAAAKRGSYVSAAKNMKIALARRRKSHLTDADIAKIREGKTCEMVKKYGISAGHVKRIKSHKNWRDFNTNPFAGLFSGLLRQACTDSMSMKCTKC